MEGWNKPLERVFREEVTVLDPRVFDCPRVSTEDDSFWSYS